MRRTNSTSLSSYAVGSSAKTEATNSVATTAPHLKTARKRTAALHRIDPFAFASCSYCDLISMPFLSESIASQQQTRRDDCPPFDARLSPLEAVFGETRDPSRSESQPNHPLSPDAIKNWTKKPGKPQLAGRLNNRGRPPRRERSPSAGSESRDTGYSNGLLARHSSLPAIRAASFNTEN